ncbi:hypothetical protein [Salipaludibacillus daqingensis]|uniref:hypothetical protein n=1 Tax=Salipaludibacillus daqingensis TaxID=3041001 RepID=UPI0024751C87|nr:hypothetical protein [Salipaludibacillus daqingensis]
MVRHSSPFAGRYTRYVLSVLLLGLLGPLIMWDSGIGYSLFSIFLAVLFTIGYDALIIKIAEQKAEKMVEEKSSLIVHAVMHGPERKGFIVFTEGFVLFVPTWNKIKTIFDAKRIVRHQFDGQFVELTVRFPNKHRMFQFSVSEPEKVKLMLTEKSGESLPYKYDKMKKNENV